MHHAEDEAFYVLEGEVTFHRGDESLHACAGSFVWLTRGVPHWFQVEASGPARLLQLTVPAGLEKFFEEAGTSISRSTVAPQEPPNFEKLLALASKYDVELLPLGAPQ